MICLLIEIFQSAISGRAKDCERGIFMGEKLFGVMAYALGLDDSPVKVPAFFRCQFAGCDEAGSPPINT